MARPRSTLVSVADTPYYHCVGRCVRQAFLCGEDRFSGKSYAHRRTWIVERLALLADVFAIDLCAYAVMNNHYHIVVKLEPARSQQWTAYEVAYRWSRVFSGGEVVARQLLEGDFTLIDQDTCETFVAKWRNRLSDLSWFMRCLNEYIARRANQEDGRTGHFWESRYKSQALLDDVALLTAMAYVDLNPIRAGLSDTVRNQAFTSVQQRLVGITGNAESETPHSRPRLLQFVGEVSIDSTSRLPFSLQDYLDLVDTTGRCIRPDKCGYIANHSPRLLAMLGVRPNEWFKTVTQLQTRFELFSGSPNRLREIAQARQWRWVRGARAKRTLYAEGNQ